MMSCRYGLLKLLYRYFYGDFGEEYKKITRSDCGGLEKEYYDVLVDIVKKKNSYYKSLKNDFPLLTKENIRENYDELTSYFGKGVYKNSSGGSTGQPITLVQDKEYRNWTNATERYYYVKFLGVDYFKTKKVVLWGSERDALRQFDYKGKIFNWLSNTVFLNTFNVGEKDWVNYIDVINHVKPVFIKGYAGSLYQIAKIIKKKNIKICRPVFLYSSAETLNDFMRKEIEDVFESKVYDFYGSREVGPIAGECRSGKKHIFMFNNKVEIIDFKKDYIVPSGKIGRVVVTNLHNYSMPLIRYVIGDVGSVSNEKCQCGCTLPWFISLDGRVTDYFLTKNGTMIHGEFFTHLFYFRDWVDKFQVNQINYDLIEILVVKSKAVGLEDVAEINSKIDAVMGGGCRIDWKYVDYIPSTEQGKFLYTRNLMV